MEWRLTTILTTAGLLAVTVTLWATVLKPDQAPPQEDLFHKIQHIALQPGDLIFRRGHSLLSRAVRTADPGSPFSHVGLVHIADGQTSVIHALPPDETSQQGGVLIEPLAAYLSAQNASRAAVYRLRKSDPALAAQAAEIAYGYAVRGTPFDHAFDLSDQRALYCTELVWTAYQQAGIDLVAGHFDKLDFPLREEAVYVLLSTLTQSPELKVLGAPCMEGS